MRRRTTFIEEFEDVECELTFEPVEWIDMHKAKVGDKIVIAYCVQDNNYRDVDDLLGDCMGRIVDAHNGRSAEKEELYTLAGCDQYGDKNLDAVWEKHWQEAIRRYVERLLSLHTDEDTVTEYEERDAGYARRDGETTAETARRYVTADAEGAHYWNYVMQEDDMQTVLGEMWEEPAFWPGNPDAVILDVYDHSGQSWSLSGGGMQCRWDTSRGAGAWVPDKCLLDQIESDVAEGLDRRTQCRKYARQFLDTYNDIISGNVYGCVAEWFDEDGTSIDNEACWGFIGSDHAEETLKDEFFGPVCERLRTEYDYEVRTQGGRQVEIEA